MPLLQKAYLGSTPLFKLRQWFEAFNPTVVNFSNAALDAGATAHTKGAWTQIFSSTSANSSLAIISVGLTQSGGANNAVLLDIATGASGSESVIISNVGVGGAAAAAINGYQCIFFQVPLKIASGTRVAARIQSVRTDETNCRVSICLVDDGGYDDAPTSLDTYGSNTATSEALNMSGSSGTWVEATASTTQAYRAVCLVGSCHGAVINGNSCLYKIGVGASGSEVGFGECYWGYTGGESVFCGPPYITTFARAIPSGSRLAVQHNLSEAAIADYGCTVIGIP